MKIIQSFSYIPSNATYNLNYDKYFFLNGYLMLLSYLTLKKYYGSVTMYCDQEAYDKIIKYIPYDEIIMFENKYKNQEKLWNVYKVLVINEQTESFIHVDTDVFIFDYVFDNYIYGDYEMLYQDILLKNQNPVLNNFKYNSEIYRLHNLIDDDYVDGFASGGVIGFKNNLNSIENYKKINKKLYDLCDKNLLYLDDPSKAGIIIEEYGLHLVQQLYKYKAASVLNQDLVNKYGSLYAGQYSKYTHMWFKSRLVKENTMLVKNKILRDFPQYKKIVDIFDTMSDGFVYDHEFGSNIDRYYRKNW